MNLYNNLTIENTNNNIIGIIDYSGIGDVLLTKKISATKAIARGREKGVDDYIWIKKIQDNVYKMDLISPKGEEGDMCGNGIICVLKSLRRREAGLSRITLLTRVGRREVVFKNNKYYAVLGSPAFNARAHYYGDVAGGGLVFLRNRDELVPAYVLDVGEPHAVIIQNEAKKGFNELMPMFERYNREKKLFPVGINFNLARINGDKSIVVETFERGCLRKTLSCGTGSVSSAAILQRLGRVRPGRTNIATPGGEFSVDNNNNNYTMITNSYENL